MIRSLPAEAALGALLDALESARIGCTVILERGDALERVYANAPIASIFGVDAESMKRVPPRAMLPEKELERLSAVFAEGGMEDGWRRAVRTEIVRPDGSAVPVEIGMGRADLEGARAMFVFMRDVSENVRMENAVRESEERFRKLAEVSPDSITVFVEGRYVYGNPIALRLLGLSSVEELKNVDPWAKVPDERRAAVAEHVARLSRGERPPPMVHRFARPDGQETIVEASVALASMGGKPAIVSYARDITERMRLQAELAQQDRLASVGMLAAGVAHELNNPLTAIAIQIRTLRSNADAHGLSPSVRAVLEQLDEAAARMSSIIGDLLFMARPATQPQAHVDVEQILTSTIALLRAGMGPAPRLETDIGELPPIQAYASKLGQVFLNVLRNALQAVEGVENGVIRVSAREHDGAIEVTVEDNGAGIPASVQPRLMQPFFTTKPNGTGLGLWISHTLLAEHGGTLHVSSAEGQGTTVTMRVPIGKV